MILIRIVYYFLFTGVVSVLAWSAGLLMLARNWKHPNRTRLYWTAFALSAFALVTANRNFENMAAIGMDQSAELAAQDKRAETTPEDADASETSEAGDATGDAAGEDGEADGEGIVTGEVAAAQTEEVPTIPLYKQDGKVEREEGKKIGDKTIAEAAEVEEEEQVVQGRTLTAIHLFRANHYARMYRTLAIGLFWIALVLCLVDYLAKFNTTFGAYCILPIACRFVDSFSRKTHGVLVKNASREALLEFLTCSLRKGETFIYCGAGDPWAHAEDSAPAGVAHGDTGFPCSKRRRPEASVPALARLQLADPRPWLLDTAIAGLRGIQCQHLETWEQCRSNLRPRVWPLLRTPRLNVARLNGSIAANFMLESTWFGRQCLVVDGPDNAKKWLAELQKFLRTRVHVLAQARRSVNVVWHVDVPIAEEDLKELLFLCEETNYKFVLIGPHAVSADIAERFGESYDDMPHS
ncbi:MAG: hypothetical protein O2923_02485 [Verrucomicrobia bacterium]|nr:hypothetical protein [Verrucomicrobiota bacterium]MDA1086152.1 hypothetical protein [Verrucomicrobiota bacterium]